MMLTVKLTKSSSINPQDTGLEPVATPPCWASKTAVSPNLTIPLRLLADHVIAPHYPDAADAPSRFAFSLRFQDRGRLTTAKP